MAGEPQAEAIPRDLLEKYFKDDPRLISAFENQALAVEAAFDATTGAVSATDSLQNATVITLSANSVFNNEFILTNGDGTELDVTQGGVSIRVDSTVARTNGQNVKFNAPGDVSLGLPNTGTLVSDTAAAILYLKTLDKPLLQNLVNATSPSNAAANGVPLWGMYRDGDTLHVRTS
jgi:hypothetical protein